MWPCDAYEWKIMLKWPYSCVENCILFTCEESISCGMLGRNYDKNQIDARMVVWRLNELEEWNELKKRAYDFSLKRADYL